MAPLQLEMPELSVFRAAERDSAQFMAPRPAQTLLATNRRDIRRASGHGSGLTPGRLSASVAVVGDRAGLTSPGRPVSCYS